MALRTGAPILLHPGDLPLWHMRHPDLDPSAPSPTVRSITVAGTDLTVLHTPGHSPRRGLPVRARPRRGVHRRHPLPGRPRRHRPIVFGQADILESIRTRLLTLPDTVVHTGHGTDTTIGAESGI